MSNYLIINPGSTAVKYTLYNNEGGAIDQQEFSRKDKNEVHTNELEWLAKLQDVEKIGIRIVHGLDISEPSLITEKVKEVIQKGATFAPLHNAIALDVIDILERIFSGTPIIAVFDTQFHVSIPDKRKIYPIKKSLTEKLGIKRYGFHGLALQSIITQLQLKRSKIPQKIIAAHLGGGCSITAIENGKSVGTTMGLTPLEGLMMITRSGNIGPDIPRIIAREMNITIDEVSDILNNESGFYGLTGSKDTLDIITRAEHSEEPYKLAFDIFVDRIVKQIFAYYGVLQGCDLLVFSGGIGFGNEYFRKIILEKLAIISIDESKIFITEVNEAAVMFDILLKNKYV